MKIHPAVFFCLLFPLPAITQSPALDSLKAAYAAATDTARYAAAIAVLEALPWTEKTAILAWRDSSAAYAVQFPEHRLTLRRNLTLASRLRNFGNFEEGYRMAMSCIPLAKKLGNAAHISRAYFEAGTSLSEFHATAAPGLLREAVQWAKKAGNPDVLAKTWTHLAYALEKTGAPADGEYLAALDSALVIVHQADLHELTLVINYHLVRYFSEKKELRKAWRCVEEARRFAPKMGHEIYQVFPLQLEAMVLEAEGKYEPALAKTEEAWQLFLKYDETEGQLELYPFLIRLYEKTGRFEKAYRYLQAWKTVKDSTLNAEKNRTVQDLQVRYETEKKEAQILEQKAALTRRTRMIQALAVALTLFIGLVLLVWQQRQKIKANLARLASLNEHISAQNQRLDLLMRELHHRVRNNLQLVSSLLHLQSLQPGLGDAATQALQAGKLRVEAMSLIHRRLYQQEGITLVDMAEVTTQLAEKTALAFHFSPEVFQFSHRLEPRSLDVAQAIPLSLIFNELLTNSFKYAFNGQPRPAVFWELAPQGNKLRFHYADNGAGLPSEASSGGFGARLLDALCQQLEGAPRRWNEGGAHFEVIF
jgi:two-component sensor histidine kinase